MQSYYKWCGNTLTLELYVQTKASRDAIVGKYGDDRLKVSITAAPTLASVADEFDDSGWQDPLISGVNSPQSEMVGVKLINSIVENGTLGVNFGDLRGLATGELYSVTGQKIETVFSCNVVSKGYYNVKTSAAGIYLLKITIEGKSIAQRLIIK